MSEFINDLEMSVRTIGICRNAGWDTEAVFLKLRKSDVMEAKGAGIRTWREINEVQQHLKRVAKRESLLAQAVDAAREANRLLDTFDPSGRKLRFEIIDGKIAITRRLV